MESLVGYGSDDESGDNYQENKVRLVKKCAVHVSMYIVLLTRVKESSELGLILRWMSGIILASMHRQAAVDLELCVMDAKFFVT